MPARRVHVVRECHHPRANHQHGTVQAYIRDGCRCDPCYKARSESESDVRKQKAYGRRGPQLVSPEPSRLHLLELQAAGISLQAAAALSGLNWTALQRIRTGKNKYVQKRTEEAILAISLDDADPSPRGLVPSLATRRRVGALTALGYPTSWQGTQIGLSPDALSYTLRTGAPVLWTTARDIAALYARIGDRPAADADRIRAGERTKTKHRAEADGWPPPAMWDDDTIDDPDWVPDMTAPTPRTTKRGDALVEDVEFLRSQCVVPVGIAERLGITQSSLVRALYHHGRGDLARWIGDTRHERARRSG